MKNLVLAMTFGALLGALPSSASAAEHPARLLQLLNHIDLSPSRAMLLEAGATEDGAALVAVARDATLPRYPRMRAAGLLAQFDRPAVRAALAGLLDDDKISDREVKIQALAALVHLDKARTFDRLSAMARDPDPELRAAAIRNLGRIEHSGKQALLHARLADGVEDVAWVKDLVRRTLTPTAP